jgi:catechol 2,3-dioxygenase-like lactoylglutathione lyase family enzyme
VDDIEKAVAFYKDVFNLEQLEKREGDAFFKLGEHQFLAIFEVDRVQPATVRHFGIMVRDEEQLEQVRQKLTKKYKLKLEPPFRCDFRDPWGKSHACCRSSQRIAHLASSLSGSPKSGREI